MLTYFGESGMSANEFSVNETLVANLGRGGISLCNGGIFSSGLVGFASTTLTAISGLLLVKPR